MSFPDKNKRQQCWDSRDKYWACLDASNIGIDQPDPPACSQVRKLFETSCPSQWVKHFDRRRSYDLFKKKLEAEGYAAPPEAAPQ